MYGCEAWAISKLAQNNLEAPEIWFLRRMLRITWAERKSNEIVLKEAQSIQYPINKIRKRQASFLRPCDEKRENGTVVCKCRRGQPTEKEQRRRKKEKVVEQHNRQSRHAWYHMVSRNNDDVLRDKATLHSLSLSISLMSFHSISVILSLFLSLWAFHCPSISPYLPISFDPSHTHTLSLSPLVSYPSSLTFPHLSHSRL